MKERTFRASEAYKLEDPDRLTWLPPSEVVEVLSIEKGMVIADVGAGTGYFTLPISAAVQDTGTVFAVDLQPQMLEVLRAKLESSGVTNVRLLVGDAAATTLPDASCDLVVLANLWHELDDHRAVLKECVRIGKSRSRLVILDWRTDANQPPGPPLHHRIENDRVVEQLEESGLAVRDNVQIGQYSYMVVANISRNVGA